MEAESDALDLARAEAIELVLDTIETEFVKPEWSPGSVAEAIVDRLFLSRADLVQRLVYPAAKRAWYDRRDSLYLPETPWFMRAGDEFGNDTVAVRVPFGGRVVIATTWPLRRFVERSDVEPVE